MTTDMTLAIKDLVRAMKTDYLRFWKAGTLASEAGTLSDYAKDQLEGFNDSIELAEGKKYIKVIRNDGQRMVWGFIVNTDNDDKFRRGDILKAASWAAPIRNKARGNVLDGNLKGVQWTGPAYLN